MLTWLDEWCDGMGLRRSEELAATGQPRDASCRNDWLAARETTLDALQARMALDAKGDDIPSPVAFLALLAPFFAEPSISRFVCAYQVTLGLLDRLQHVALNAKATALTRAMFTDPTWAVYIDVPSGLLKVGEVSELRAVFVQPLTFSKRPLVGESRPEDKVLMYCAVVAPKGRYGWRYGMWTDDRSQFVCNNVQLEGLRPEEAAIPTFDEILRRANMSAAQFQDIVECMTNVVVQHTDVKAMARIELLPYLAGDSRRRTRGLGGDVSSRFSLFKVKRLSLLD